MIWPIIGQHRYEQRSWRLWYDLVSEHQSIRRESSPSIVATTIFRANIPTMIKSMFSPCQRCSSSNDSTRIAIRDHHHAELLYSTQPNANPMELFNETFMKCVKIGQILKLKKSPTSKVLTDYFCLDPLLSSNCWTSTEPSLCNHQHQIGTPTMTLTPYVSLNQAGHSDCGWHSIHRVAHKLGAKFSAHIPGITHQVYLA